MAQDSMSAAVKQLGEAAASIMGANNAPKRVVRDEQGKIIGVETLPPDTVYNQ